MLKAENPFLTGHSCTHLSGGGKGGGGFLVKEGHFGVAVVAFLKKEAGIDPVGIVAVVGAVAVADAEGQFLGARGDLCPKFLRSRSL